MSKNGDTVAAETKTSSSEVGVEITGCINHGLPSNNSQEDKNNVCPDLWHACAGPLVYVPGLGDMVFYFPQGHMEQIAACVNEDVDLEKGFYSLPYKILCKVIHVQLKAEVRTDEVFAHITLLPVAEGDVLSSNMDVISLSLDRKICARSFTKKLTLSDTNTHGGFSVPKRHADECLPPLDMSQQPPAQELLAKDLHGTEWHFRHIYRGQPKRHLLTSGWSTFVSSKKLVAGDEFIFLRDESGELRVGVRRAIKLENNLSTNVISAHSMQHGILSSAFHAFSSGTMFTIYFHPWTSPAEFIIPFDRYIKAAEIDYSVGTRFRMLFEGEECMEQRIERFEGTVVGTGDVDHICWPNSEWRMLKVKWDATCDAFEHPKRVSPWNIEPIEPIRKKCDSLLHQRKRPRILNAPLLRSLSSVKDGSLHSPVEYACHSLSEVFQGQENGDTDASELGTFKPPAIPYLIPPLNPDWNRSPIGQHNQAQFWMHGPFFPCPCSTVSFPGGNISRLGIPNGWCPTLSSYGIHDKAVGSRSLSVPNSNHLHPLSQDWRNFELKHGNEAPLAPPQSGGRYMLFGVNLVSNPPELPSPQVATSTELESHNYVPVMSQSSVSEPSKSTSGINLEKQYCKNCCFTANRSCTKVLKYGTALGRSVDLMQFDGYNELICELDVMFEFQGSLINQTSGWYVVYSDEDGDIMLIGDSPWQEFRQTVGRMFICRKEDIGKLNPFQSH